MSTNTDGKYIKSIRLNESWNPPEWACLQQRLFKIMNQAASEFVRMYARPDGP